MPPRHSITKAALLFLSLVMCGCNLGQSPTAQVIQPTSNAPATVCDVEETELSNYSGINIHHTNNVTVTLQNSANTAVAPSTIEPGDEYTFQFYREDIVSTDTYQVSIRNSTGTQIDAYSITLVDEMNTTPVVTVTCR